MPALAVAAVLLALNVTLGFLLFTLRRPGSFTLMTGLVLVAKVAAAAILIPQVGTEGAAWSLAAGYAAGDLFLLAVVAHGWRRRTPAHELPAQADFA
jgi:O-antigen/teichoic acid export membrane protein